MAEFTIYNADCLDVMRGMEPNTIDTIITDPPYGLSFMGKEWDHGVPGVAFWQAALHVAKPGAMLFAFGGTRTQHRLTVAIEDAGWEIRDVIMWVYGSGFPKSHNISKGIDKAAGAVREVVGQKWVERYPNGPGGNSFSVGADVDGKRTADNTPITTPATDAAKLWDGWGTALKPAWEPIIVAMKPTDGTFADNAQKWGVAGLWIDGGRVGDSGARNNGSKPDNQGYAKNEIYGKYKPMQRQDYNKGRFPANLIHDGSAEVTALFPETTSPSQGIKPGSYSQGMTKGNVNDGWRRPAHENYEPKLAGYTDTGNASRFFYCAKAGKEERNAGLAGMPGKVRNDGRAEHLKSGDMPQNRSNNPKQNHHPTVKPLALMRYLVRLTATPTGGVVLDPFMGSGTTGIAALQEGRKFIGIELDADYYAIAEKRIANAAAQPPLIPHESEPKHEQEALWP